MKKQTDVAALGELLIDFTENGRSANDNPVYEANPGGAPCNVLAMLAKLGKKGAFIGKVGKDMFGYQLKDVIETAGIDTQGLRMDDEVHTTLAFVKTLAGGDRDFSFYRNPGADMQLTEEEIPYELIKNAGIFHFGTLSMTHEGVRAATISAVTAAKAAGALISFDPNLRPPLWKDLEEARVQMEWGIAHTDILKISDNELEFLTGEKDMEKAAGMILDQYPNLCLMTATGGAEGSYVFYKDLKAYAPAFTLGGTIETTGAGDTFCACVLYDILETGLENRTQSGLLHMLRFANAAAYLVTTKKGAICSMPEKSQVKELLEQAGFNADPVV